MLTCSSNRIEHFKAFENLINNKQFSDVRLTVQNREIFAHKLVLSANSAVFAAMFQHKMLENEENIVKIDDISYNTLNVLLHFIYTGECKLSEDIVIDLFKAADKYELMKLKNICEEELCRSISVNNVIALLQLADLHSAENLKKEAIELIAVQGKDIIDRPDFDVLINFNTKLLKQVFQGIFATRS
ncbi:speckle-type POZ protein-like [Phymastichus coffea]|uniref:speckle-type POZ protein-like n=1 Tax=Phymastichus coffea TaxID=108790 RepID=UPI00273B452C|nr:speckle-type POZ protein-like [Phymastichus coffea]